MREFSRLAAVNAKKKSFEKAAARVFRAGR